MQSDERPRRDVPLHCWAQLIAATLGIIVVGIVVGAVGITTVSLFVGVMLALLVEGTRR